MKTDTGGQNGNGFPRPNRSSFRPKLDRADEIYELDLGWIEGRFTDGRSYRAELWVWRDLLAVTFYFSTVGLESASAQELLDVLKKENLVLPVDHKPAAAEIVRDSAENEMWSLSVPLVRAGEIEARTEIRFHPYAGHRQQERIHLPSGVISLMEG